LAAVRTVTDQIRARVWAWRLARQQRWREGLASSLDHVSDRWLAEHHHTHNDDVERWLITH